MAESAIAAPMAGPAAPARSSAARRYSLLFLLVIAYILSVVDRMIITMLVDPIRASLHLSDFQVSVIYGAAFSFCYTLIGGCGGR